MVAVFIATLKQMMFTILTMLFILATARVMQYSGMIAAVAALFSVFGPVYPFFAPMLGALVHSLQDQVQVQVLYLDQFKCQLLQVLVLINIGLLPQTA